MPEPAGPSAPPRPGRCANHPGVASVGACDACGRTLCAACAVPVRGGMVGPECLATVLHESPPGELPTPVQVRRGDRLAITGFAISAALTIFPWSRFGDASRFFGAWSLHWSLVASIASVAGLVAAVAFTRRPSDPLFEILVYAGLGLAVVGASWRHHHHPPPLSVASVVPYLAVVGGCIALAGAAIKAAAMLSARRPGPFSGR